MYLDEFDPSKPFCLDVETISYDDNVPALRWQDGHRVSGFAVGQVVSLSPFEVKAKYLPIRHRTEAVLPYIDVVEEMKQFCSEAKKYVNHNLKFDMHMSRMDGVNFPAAELVDTMVLARVHRCDELKYDLDYLSKKYNKVYAKEGDPIHDWCIKNKTKDYGAVPIELMSKYACADVCATLELAYVLGQRMKEMGYDLRCWETEKRLTRILYDSERKGVPVSVEYLRGESVRRLLAQHEQMEKISEICGADFNPGSSPQTRMYFHSQGVHTKNLTSTGRDREKEGKPAGPEYESFGKETLLEIINQLDEDELEDDTDAHEQRLASGSDYKSAAYWLIRYNKECHNYSTFCKGWLESLAEGSNILVPGYRQSGTGTGRLSMGKPSLHNYPPWAAEGLKIAEGMLGIAWDASQIEYRIFAHFAGQAWLYDAYGENPHLDFHQLVADKLGIPRKPSKTLNFAILYGIGVGKLIRYLTQFILENDTPELRKTMTGIDPHFPLEGELHQSHAENVARVIRKNFLEENPGIEMLKNVFRDGLNKRRSSDMPGFICNFYGRRYHSEIRFVYRLLNYLCQGTAADWFKETMVLIFTDPRLTAVGINGENMDTNIHDSVKAQVPFDRGQLYWDVTKEHAERKIFRTPILIDGEIALDHWANCFAIIGDDIDFTYQCASNYDYYANYFRNELAEIKQENSKFNERKELWKILEREYQSSLETSTE